MTDKQIIINGKECRYWFRLNPDDYRKCSLRGKNDNCDEIKDCFVKELLSKLALKEQELQEAMDNYVQLDLQRVKEYNELVELYKAKEQECEELKETIDGLLKIQYQLADSCTKYEQTIAEIKPILELYANSKIGEEQLDGTYKITVKNSSVLGDTYITFDPRPAKQALQKISECEGKQ